MLAFSTIHYANNNLVSQLIASIGMLANIAILITTVILGHLFHYNFSSPIIPAFFLLSGMVMFFLSKKYITICSNSEKLIINTQKLKNQYEQSYLVEE
jgi:hypothetical protein